MSLEVDQILSVFVAREDRCFAGAVQVKYAVGVRQRAPLAQRNGVVAAAGMGWLRASKMPSMVGGGIVGNVESIGAQESECCEGT